jgi:hypothetical protein
MSVSVNLILRSSASAVDNYSQRGMGFDIVGT